MKNRYEICGDVVVIHLRRPGVGTWHKCLIDMVDLPLLLPVRVTWYANPARKNGTKFYATGKEWANGETHTVLMHRLLCFEPRYDVHHKDNDGLNNRRGNLEHLTHQANMRERFPGTDWPEVDRRRVLAEEYRTERAIAVKVQAQFGLSRQGLWKIRKGAVSRSGAADAYRAECSASNVRTLEVLMMENPVDGKFGVMHVPAIRSHSRPSQ